jgi:hypothetical protein
MFVRNDPSAEKLYYNGKIGKITKISSKNISVICPGDKQKIVVEPIDWQNIKYTVNEKNIEKELAIDHNNSLSEEKNALGDD